jgi:hypothetical protein
MDKLYKEIKDILYNNNLIITNKNMSVDKILLDNYYTVHIEVTQDNPYMCLEMYYEITEIEPDKKYWKNIIRTWNKCFKKNKINAKAEFLIMKYGPYFKSKSFDDSYSYDNEI